VIGIIIRRASAYLLDALFVFLVFVVVSQIYFFVPLRHLIIGSEDWFRSGWNTEVYTLLTMSLPACLYFALFEISAWQATPGKRLLGLKTLDLTTRNRISLLQAIMRTLLKLLPWEIAHLTNNLPTPMWYDPDPGFRIGFIVVPLLVVIDIILVLVTQNRQSFHDWVAKTIVVTKS
jgi:uncharacterized RDD family membrane protein YckC